MVAPGSDISLHSLGTLWIIPRQPPSSSRARQNTPSSIASVRRPVCVFCYHM
jgi:hypothetical protein